MTVYIYEVVYRDNLAVLTTADDGPPFAVYR